MLLNYNCQNVRSIKVRLSFNQGSTSQLVEMPKLQGSIFEVVGF